MICTFYSFKGGVGRSMALANVAEQLYADGLSVLMVDFDLEAPGLERYFSDRLQAPWTLQKVLEKRGVLDLLVSYKELRALSAPASITGTEPSLDDRIHALPVEPLSEFIVDIAPKTDENSRGLSLITAGRRSDEQFKAYARDVLNFNWDDFYANSEGELFFEWFRREAERYADVVLLDSRTGITEMSGVCTYHLADLVVSFVAANQQNQEGTLRLARSLANDDLIRAGRKGRSLNQIFVPSRVEISEGDRVKEFEARFRKLVEESFPHGVPGQNPLSFDIALPYVPYFAFDEKVAVRESSHPLAKLLTEPVARLAALIARNSPIGSPLYRTYHSNADENARIVEDLFQASSPDIQLQMKKLFSRLVYVYPNSPLSIATAYMMDLPIAGRKLAEDLTGLRLLKSERDAASRQFVQLADDSLLKSWPRIQEWTSSDRSFLVWRQGLAPKLATWEKNKTPGDLLAGTALDEASQWATSRPDDLSERESVFVRESIHKATGAEQPSALSMASLSVKAFKNDKNESAILFVHGFGGDAARTWGRFPEFLAADRRTRAWDALGLGFPASVSFDIVGLWSSDAPLQPLADALRLALDHEPLRRYRRIAILAHSLAGLVVQRTLVDSDALASRVSHLFLFSTPSAGLRRASPFSFWKRQARDLSQQSPFIGSLRHQWRERFAQHSSFNCYAIAADRDEFVPSSSSLDPFRADQRWVMSGTHSSIVKPSSPDDLSVQLVLKNVGAQGSVPGILNQARVAIEARDLQTGVNLLWPLRAELDRDLLGLLAFAMDELGRTDDAIELLQRDSGGQAGGGDGAMLLASRYRRRWLAESRRSDAERALQLYADALKAARDSGNHSTAGFVASNIMFMKLAYGSDLEEARQAAEIALVHSQQAPDDVWIRATQGEALLVLGSTAEALRKYQAVAAIVRSPFEAESISRQALRLADLLNDDEAAKALPLIFRGPDAPAAA